MLGPDSGVSRRLRDLPHLCEHIVGRNQLPSLDGTIGVCDRLVKLSQLVR
jgi:hypothetical protein